MSELRLSAFNLNLLLALDALLQEGNVTRAARRLHITQSAMSHNLAQLRELLGDPLLIRGKAGMTLTPRAVGLAAALRRGLEQLQRALGDGPVFAPETATRTFVLTMGDFLAVHLMPRLLARLRVGAPGLGFTVVPVDRRRQAEQLESGEVDLGVGVNFERAPGVRSTPALAQRFVSVVRRDHPEIRGELTLEQFERWPHVVVGEGRGDGGIVDAALARLGRTRNVALRVPYFLAAPVMVAASDMILTTAELVAEHFARHYPLQRLTPPVALAPFAIDMVWHERFERDPAHTWLRGQVEAVLREPA
uniref:Transcriptional regulator LysR family n=1 Tax=Nannocystis exedens TaxID=54 RepID=A0A3S5GYQ4_9BACT|nr:transcriptional regulator LysR family [Nannocystis exedens]